MREMLIRAASWAAGGGAFLPPEAKILDMQFIPLNERIRDSFLKLNASRTSIFFRAVTFSLLGLS
jgi:hypothetical protein